MADSNSGIAPVSDRRVAPRGVLPRRAQTWIMAGLAVGVLGIVMLTGRPEPGGSPVTTTTSATASPSPDRLRDFQDRLRVLDMRARQQMLDEPRETAPVPRYEQPVGAPAPDPVQAERRRRDYESLFASNVAFSRRPDGQRLMSGREQGLAGASISGSRQAEASIPAPPTIDEVADAVVRATARQAQPLALHAGNAEPAGAVNAASAQAPATSDRPTSTGPINSAGPLHRVLEGTVIDTVLMNRLDGSTAAPVNCLVTNAVYSHSGQHVLIPAGARVIGETKPVQSIGETRLAVVFHRLVLPDGRTYGLDQVTGLNQVGDAGLEDQVNHHTWSTVGAAGAIGLISGLAQFFGSGGFAGGDGDRTIVITGGLGNATSQATAETMSRFLNRLPTVTIREGHRVKVYLTTDIELPVYTPPHTVPAMLGRQIFAGGRP
jgi:type IV secretion system protein VirB10